ncbi:TetR-like C-terminal domain-containing protein [Vibrio tritonius]|uniref:TetR-like C-terminal domain-containing protein n=1 Tax=Vibrio tritonius TaxID=1435069 RepID=UPI000838CAD7|nr:TetR-like C-terminal domain-containing protein [Vibrio tritonius]
MLGTFEYIEENVDVFKTLLMNGGATSFKETLQEMVFSGLTKANRNQHTEDSIPQEIKYHFVASAMTGTIEWWVKSPARYKPAIMVEHILNLLHKLR